VHKYKVKSPSAFTPRVLAEFFRIFWIDWYLPFKRNHRISIWIKRSILHSLNLNQFLLRHQTYHLYTLSCTVHPLS